MREIKTMFDYIDYDEGRDPVSAKSWELRPSVIVLLMGVAGAGKTCRCDACDGFYGSHS
jgi:gluconokinase